MFGDPQFLRVNKRKDVEIIFDANIKSKNFKFFNLNSVNHSYNHQYLAYNVDTNGSEYCDLSVEEISTNKIITKKIENTTGEIVWHPNNNIVFYTALDDNHRPNKIFAHKIGSDPKNDKCIFEEKDAAYFCSPSISQSKKYLFNTSSFGVLSLSTPEVITISCMVISNIVSRVFVLVVIVLLGFVLIHKEISLIL